MSCVFTIVGATGDQGRSVISATLASKYLQGMVTGIRAVTRDASTERAKEVKAMRPDFIELCECDITKREDVVRAFDNSYCIFFNLNSYDPSIGAQEEAIGKMAVDLAREAKATLFLYSSLPNASVRSNGQYFVPHFTLKARVEEYLRATDKQGGSEMDFIAFQPGFYFSNFEKYFVPRKDSDGSYVVSLSLDPSVPIAGVDIRDMGAVVTAAMEQREHLFGKAIPIVREALTMPQYAAALAKHTGKPVKYVQISREETKALMGPELTDMFSYFNDYTYYPPDADLKTCTTLYPDMRTFDQYLESVHYSLD